MMDEEMVICPICGEENKKENMVSHVWDIGDVEDPVCPSCRENECL